MPTKARALKGISSMATRLLLAQLTEQYERESGQAVAIESVGGVKASQRVLDGEQFDLVVLAADAMAQLADAGKIDRGTLVGVVSSPIAAAARTGFAAPDMGNEQAIRDAVRGAQAIGYSTGPSGTYILSLLARWGLSTGADASAPRLVQARPGVPVGSLVASGEVEHELAAVSVPERNVLVLVVEPHRSSGSRGAWSRPSAAASMSAVICSANSIAPASASPGSVRTLTNPHASACSAVKLSPVSASWSAF